ncbi:uncharacterized protein DUF1707 [Pseudonocardia autotrophica]|uniref:DUF1707 domain-containing protein n=2 Tax=Pseudonocardia TaxID=1847 RepID=A0A1Y2MWC0_PSEAH|nr:hypothetical protein BG845_03426 [Pseudonocardia autotrophica]TDN75282.1 uncharacterized protein DUF1707 [Pseudonocardia autotrophica]BBF99228.1 hypothetical protein Pdca_04380 [Pseudonocardia autotrophica]GEC24774.1 hypothetical protein PSA01_18030 [Pseudonocardia saturnea]
MDAVNEPVHPEQVRISDAERHAVAERLRTAHDDGFIDLSEFDERIAEVWRMRTRGELGRVTRDLPPPQRRRNDGLVFADSAGGVAMKVLAVIWLCLTAVAVSGWGIVALTAGVEYPWFLWVSAPPGAVLLTLWLTGIGRPRRGNR